MLLDPWFQVQRRRFCLRAGRSQNSSGLAEALELEPVRSRDLADWEQTAGSRAHPLQRVHWLSSVE
jgi:hypothetical protein